MKKIIILLFAYGFIINAIAQQESSEPFKHANQIIYRYPENSGAFYFEVIDNLESNGFTIDTANTSNTIITSNYKVVWKGMGVVQKYRLKIKFVDEPKSIAISGDGYNTGRFTYPKWDVECLSKAVNKKGAWGDIHRGFMQSFNMDSVTYRRN